MYFMMIQVASGVFHDDTSGCIYIHLNTIIVKLGILLKFCKDLLSHVLNHPARDFVATFFHNSSFPFQEKLCQLVLSLPVFEVCTLSCQQALKVTNFMFFIDVLSLS